METGAVNQYRGKGKEKNQRVVGPTQSGSIGAKNGLMSNLSGSGDSQGRAKNPRNTDGRGEGAPQETPLLARGF